MELNSFFNDFLAEIRPTEKQIDDFHYRTKAVDGRVNETGMGRS